MRPATLRQTVRALAHLEYGPHPLTPGRVLYLLKTKFGHGLRVAYYRDAIRPRILDMPPIDSDDALCEIHVLTSAGDWLNLLWALRTFYHYSARRYALCIHDDGTLDSGASRALRAAFPAARLISRPEADARLETLLASSPRCRALRARNNLSLKVFDFAAFLSSDRMMILDSDVLFFAPPLALLERLETFGRNTLNRDWRPGYTCDPATIAPLLDFTLPPLINSGLGLLHRASLRLDWCEEFLALPGILGHPHQIEQTLLALCSSRFGYEMLPGEYDVQTGPLVPGAPCRHYAGPMRPQMYGEGIRRLVQQGFLDSAAV